MTISYYVTTIWIGIGIGTEIEIGETIQTAVTDVTIATELADTTIADEEVPDHDRETGEGTGAGRENMTEMGRGRKMVGAVEGKGEIVRSAAGVEAGVGVETAIESRRVCYTLHLPSFQNVPRY